MKILAIDNVFLGTYFAQGAISDQAARSAPIEAETEYLERPGAPSRFVSRSPRPRVVKIPIVPLHGSETLFDRDGIVTLLRMADDGQITLLAERQDGTDVENLAEPKDLEILPHGLLFVCTIADPVWRVPVAAATTRTRTLTSATLDVAMPVDVDGQQAVRPVITIKPTAVRTTTTQLWGQKYRRTVMVTNNGTHALNHYPVLLPLGSTAAWVTASQAASDGDDVHVWYQGRDLPRSFVNFNTIDSYVWVNVTIPAGEAATYEIVYGSNAGIGYTTLGTDEEQDYPAIIIDSDNGTATSGGASTLTDSSKAFPTDWWARAYITIASGTGAGQTKQIASNTGTVITIVGTWTTNPAAGSKYTIMQATNTFWPYPINRNGNAVNGGVGMWYIDGSISRPGVISFDGPARWQRVLVYDNRDDFNSQPWSLESSRYIARLDAERWREGAKALVDEGQSDGISLYNPLGITNITFNFQFLNQQDPATGNAIGKFQLLGKESASSQWETLYESAAVHASLTAIGIQSITPSAPYPRHVAFVLAPGDEVEIPQSVTPDRRTEAFLNSVMELTLDGSGITVGSISAEESIHVIYGSLRLGGGAAATDLPYDTLHVGGHGDEAATSGWLALPITNQLVIDCEHRTAREYTSAGVLVGDRSWAVEFTRTETILGVTRTTRAPDWFAISPRFERLLNPSFTTDLTDWVAGGGTAGVTAAVTRFTSLFVSSPAALRINVTANSAGVGAFYNAETAGYAVEPGLRYTLTAYGRVSNANIRPQIALHWYTAGGTYISSSEDTGWTPVADTWLRRAVTGVAPATAAYLHAGATWYGITAGVLGSAYFDDFQLEGNDLFFSDVDVNTLVSVAFRPGYL